MKVFDHNVKKSTKQWAFVVTIISLLAISIMLSPISNVAAQKIPSTSQMNKLKLNCHNPPPTDGKIVCKVTDPNGHGVQGIKLIINVHVDMKPAQSFSCTTMANGECSIKIVTLIPGHYYAEIRCANADCIPEIEKVDWIVP